VRGGRCDPAARPQEASARHERCLQHPSQMAEPAWRRANPSRLRSGSWIAQHGLGRASPCAWGGRRGTIADRVSMTTHGRHPKSNRPSWHVADVSATAAAGVLLRLYGTKQAMTGTPKTITSQVTLSTVEQRHRHEVRPPCISTIAISVVARHRFTLPLVGADQSKLQLASRSTSEQVLLMQGGRRIIRRPDGAGTRVVDALSSMRRRYSQTPRVPCVLAAQ
jgi:hypothetical protein